MKFTTSIQSSVAGTAQFDQQEVELHDPDLYSPNEFAPQVPDLRSIGDEQVEFYNKWGYLSVAQAFTFDETSAALDAVLDLVAGTKPEFKGITFEAAARDRLDSMTLTERQDAVRKVANFVDHDARLHALAFHHELLAVIQRLMGDEPVMFQDMALLKPPRLGREKPWHQDLSYFNYDVRSRVVGVWIALDEATVANGCMQLLTGEHLEPILHWKRRDWQICDSIVQGRHSTAAPLKPGGLLLFDGLLPHGTPNNHSESRRRALQFHYHGAHSHSISATERMTVFGSEGRDVTCEKSVEKGRRLSFLLPKPLEFRGLLLRVSFLLRENHPP